MDSAALKQGWVNIFLPLKNRFQFSDCMMYLSAAPVGKAMLDKDLTRFSHCSVSETEHPPSVVKDYMKCKRPGTCSFLHSVPALNVGDLTYACVYIGMHAYVLHTTTQQLN